MYVDDKNIEEHVEHSEIDLLVKQHDEGMLNQTKVNEIISQVEKEQVAKSPPIFVPLNDLLLSDITEEDISLSRRTPRVVIHNKTGILSEEDILGVTEAQTQYKIINNQPNEKFAIGGGLRGLRGLQKLKQNSS